MITDSEGMDLQYVAVKITEFVGDWIKKCLEISE